MKKNILLVISLVFFTTMALSVGTIMPAFAVTSIPVGSGPYGVAIDATTNTIYVTNQNDGTVSVIDGSSNTQTATIPLDGAGPSVLPFNVAIDAATNTIYVANFGLNTVSVIDGLSNTETTTIPVGTSPRGIAIDATTNTIYVTNNNDGTVSVIDGSTNTPTATITVGPGPRGIAVDATTNTIYVTNNDNGTVSVIDGSSNTQTAIIQVGSGPESGPTAVAVDAATNKIYVTNQNDGTVSVIDGSSNTQTATISVGSGITSGPFGIAVDESTNKIYVTNQNDGTVSVIDGSSNTQTAIIPVGSGSSSSPIGIAVDASTHTAYVANFNDGTVSIVPPTTTVITPTTTSISSSLNPSNFGQPVTFTAAVTPSTATGTIQFQLFAVNIGSPVTLSGGPVTFTTSSIPVGAAQQITAIYSGDTNNAGSSSPILYQIVNQDPTTITLSSSINPSTFGQSVTFTATVSPSTATGTVTFNIDGVPQPPVPLSAGQATFISSSLSVGTHQITATYSGDTNDVGSTSTILTQTVNQISTTTTLSSSINPSTFGQSVTFTATVSPSTATGTVTFNIDGVPQPPVPLSAGHATLTSSSLSGGTHQITATYSGDTNNAGSSSPVFTQTVNQISAGTTLSSSINPSTFGQSVTFTATVSPSTATGTVTFNIDGVPQPPVPLSAGNATLTSSSLSGGTHQITATYSGDTNHVGSSSPVFTQTVNQISTTTTLSSSINPSTFGQSVTFTATVSPSTATGTVTFNIDGVPQPPVPLSAGHATLTSSSLSGGTHQITATYSGDTNNAGSTSTILTQTVNMINTTTSLSSSTSSIFLGQPVTFTATVSPSSATGTIQFLVNGTNFGSPVTLSGGTASFTTSSLPIGNNNIVASYSGNVNFRPSTSTSVLVSVSAIQSPLAEKNNVITTLTALSPHKHDNAEDLQQAIKKVKKSTDSTLWQADGIRLNTKNGEQAFEYEQEAVHRLMDILDDDHESKSFDSSIQKSIDQLVHADKTISTIAITDASSSSGGDAKDDLAKALKEMAKASDDNKKGHYASAIKHYKNAWNLAQEAIQDSQGYDNDRYSNDDYD